MNLCVWKPLAIASLVLVVLSGCVSTGSNESADKAVPLEPRGVPIFDGYSGSPVSWRSLVEAAAGADVVVIGEMHGHTLGLAAAAALWEDVLASDLASSPALCLEFIERDEQALLDDYLMGVTDEAGFRKAAKLTDRNYPPGHSAMVKAAKEAGVPVLGSNAPRRYSTHAREESLEALAGLRASQRALFDAPDSLPEGDYRDRFFELFRGMLASHGEEDLTDEQIEEKVEGYFRAQTVWDATMADSIAGAIAAGRRPVVQVVGQFHSDFGGGLLDQIWRHRPGARVVTISMVSEPDVGGDDAGRADFIVDVGGGSTSH